MNLFLESTDLYRLALLGCGLIAVPGIFAVTRFKNDPEQQSMHKFENRDIFLIMPVGLILVCIIFSQGAAAVCHSFCNAYMDESLRLSPDAIGVLGAQGQLCVVIVSLSVPRLTRYLKIGKLLAVASMGTAVMLLPLSFIENWACWGSFLFPQSGCPWFRFTRWRWSSGNGGPWRLHSNQWPWVLTRDTELIWRHSHQQMGISNALSVLREPDSYGEYRALYCAEAGLHAAQTCQLALRWGFATVTVRPTCQLGQILKAQILFKRISGWPRNYTAPPDTFPAAVPRPCAVALLCSSV